MKLLKKELEVIQKLKEKLRFAKSVHTNPVEIGVKDLEIILNIIDRFIKGE
jgi:hypothetical protein